MRRWTGFAATGHGALGRPRYARQIARRDLGSGSPVKAAADDVSRIHVGPIDVMFDRVDRDTHSPRASRNDGLRHWTPCLGLLANAPAAVVADGGLRQRLGFVTGGLPDTDQCQGLKSMLIRRWTTTRSQGPKSPWQKRRQRRPAGPTRCAKKTDSASPYKKPARRRARGGGWHGHDRAATRLAHWRGDGGDRFSSLRLRCSIRNLVASQRSRFRSAESSGFTDRHGAGSRRPPPMPAATLLFALRRLA